MQRLTYLLPLALTVHITALAQPIPAASIADKDMGWREVYNFRAQSEPLTVGTRVYSAAQRTIAVDLANWMQASYSPVGGRGDVVRTFPRAGPAVPQSYGVAGQIFTELKYGANRKIELRTSASIIWNVTVNGSFGVAARALSTPDRYYFTIPPFDRRVHGEDLEKAVDLSGHPFLGPFPALFLSYPHDGNRISVLLAKDARLPFVKLTRGEYLDAVGVAITQAYFEERRRVTQAEQGNQERIARFLAPYEQRTAKRREVLGANRAKYKNRLHEVAEIWTTEPAINLEDFPDVFEGNGGTAVRLPVYTIDATTLERSKSDPPQWIVVSWTAQLNEPASRHLFDAVLNQFNFEYLYNRFFDPAKVKGLPYTPLRPVRDESAAMEASGATSTVTADPGVYFFEDFSTTLVGTAPRNWRSNLNNLGASSVVVEPTGLEGHWAALNGFAITPTQLNGPLPRDFTVSYDLAAVRNYTWGAKGMTFKLSKGVEGSGSDAIFSVRLRPGFGGNDGEVVVEGVFRGALGHVDGTRRAVVPGFSNNQQNNRVTVSIRKRGETVQIFIGETMVIEYLRAIPASLLFDAVSFRLQGNGSPNDQMFISNIRIAKN